MLQKRYLATTHTGYFFIQKSFYSLLVTCIIGPCLTYYLCKTPVHTLYQSDCNHSTMAKTKEVFMGARDDIVDLHETG